MHVMSGNNRCMCIWTQTHSFLSHHVLWFCYWQCPIWCPLPKYNENQYKLEAESVSTFHVIHSTLLTIDNSGRILAPYHVAARWIPLAINQFVGITRIIYAGLEPDDPDAEYSFFFLHHFIFQVPLSIPFSYTDDEIQLHEHMMALIPRFWETITEFHKRPDQLEMFINLVCRYIVYALNN